METRQVLLLALCLLLVGSNADGNLRLGNSALPAADLMGEVRMIDGCKLVISPLKLRGNLMAVIVPAGAEGDIADIAENPANRLDYDLARDEAADAWTLTVDAPCAPAVSSIAVYCRSCSHGLTVVRDATVAVAPVAGAPSGGATVVLIVDDGALPVAPRRRLLAGTCSGPLTVGSTSVAFDNCVPLTPSLNLYYTLTPSGAGSLFTGGLKAMEGGSYNSFAVSPDGTGTMIGADSVIVYPDAGAASGATVTGIVLKSYNVAALNAAKGSFDIGTTTAAKNPDGSLAATFSFPLPDPPATYADAATPLVYLYLTGGPMGGTNLGDHTRSNADYSANVLNLKASAKAAAPATPTAAPVPAAPVPTPTPVPAPVPAPVVPSGDDDGYGDDDAGEAGEAGREADDDDAGEAGMPMPTPAVQPPAQPTLPTPAENAASDASAAASASGACSVTVGSETLTYEACYPVSVGQGTKVFFTYAPDPSNPSASLLKMAITSTSTGYVSVGFPSNPGSMTNAAAAIVKTCSTCPSGADMQQYWMSGTRVSDVNPGDKYNMTSFTASSANGILSGAFTMQVSGAARRRLAQISAAGGAVPLIYAAGPVNAATGAMMTHSTSNSASGDLNLKQGLAGAGAGADTVVTTSSSDGYKTAHMWISTISWGVLIPLCILTARSGKPHTPHWFNIHRGVTTFAYICALVGLGLGFAANNGAWDTAYPVHRNLGVACTVLGFVQMLSLISVLRPAKDHKMRPYWFMFHAWTGRSASILAIANIYYGILKVEEGLIGDWAWIVYTVFLCCVVAAGVVMEVVNRRLARKTVADDPLKAGFIASASEPVSRSESNQAFGSQTFNKGSPSTQASSDLGFAEVELGKQ